jgi:5-methylcytosine-specific restriction protein A
VTQRLRGRRGMEQRARRMARTSWLCEMCLELGKPRTATVVDHVKPLAHGGLDIDENTRNLCDDHHREVTALQFGHRKRQAIGLDGWPR